MLHQIGSGVLGPVFRAYEPQRDRLLAVKAFRLDLVPEVVVRLADALRALAAVNISDPTIVACVDAGLEGTTAYLVMEYVAAETLDVALRHLAPAPLDRALPLLSQMAQALDAGWAAGIGHGALHPRDVFIAPGTADVRVTGFGVVRALESVGVKAPVRRPYTAPERANGEPWDIRADVYTLGAIAHEVLTKRRPAGPGEQDGALVTGMTPEQRVQIRRVLSAALAERPEHRFASGRAFIEAVEAVARGEAVSALPEGADAHAASARGGLEPAGAGVRVEDAAAGGASTVVLRREDVAPAAAAPRVSEEAKVAERASDRTMVSDRTRVADQTRVSDQTRVADQTRVSDQAKTGGQADAGDRTKALDQKSARPVEPAASSPWQPVSVTPRPAPAAEPGDTLRVSGELPLRAGLEGHGDRSARRNEPAIWATGPLLGAAPPESPAPLPWGAFAAVAIAALMVGGVGGYALGVRRAVPAPVAALVAPPVAAPTATPPANAERPGDTEVVVPPPAAPSTGAKPAESAPPPAEQPAASAASKPAASPAKPEPISGRLLVHAEPVGATVLVDGRPRGETPAAIRDLALGAHTVEVTHPGYAPRSARVTLTTSMPARSLTLDLDRLTSGRGAPAAPGAGIGTGSIFVDSHPRGARVLVDGRVVGTTPLQIPDVKAGAHAVRLELAGHKPLATSVDVKPGTPARLQVTLEEGLLMSASRPKGRR